MVGWGCGRRLCLTTIGTQICVATLRRGTCEEMCAARRWRLSVWVLPYKVSRGMVGCVRWLRSRTRRGDKAVACSCQGGDYVVTCVSVRSLLPASPPEEASRFVLYLTTPPPLSRPTSGGLRGLWSCCVWLCGTTPGSGGVQGSLRGTKTLGALVVSGGHLDVCVYRRLSCSRCCACCGVHMPRWWKVHAWL